MLGVPPFEHHSILLFEHGAQNGLADFFTVGNAAGLRLVPYYSFVLHVKTTGFAMVPVQVVNLGSIALSMVAMAAYARYLTKRVEMLVLVPLLYFSCFIWWQTVEWTPGRQETFVLIFSGFSLAVFHAVPRPGWKALATVGALLVLAGLSKETGMVAMVYAALVGAFDRERRAYLLPAVASAAVVVGIREAVLVYPYAEPGVIKCEDMSFLTAFRETCTTLNFADMGNVLQIAWNLFLGTYLALVPQLFDRYIPLVFGDVIGLLQPDLFGWRYAAYAALCLCAFLFAARSNWRVTLCAMLLVGLNAAVLVSFWRLRNMGVGHMGGVAILAFGLLSIIEAIARLLPATQWRAATRNLLVAATATILLALNVPQATRFLYLSESTNEYRTAKGAELACAEAAKVINRRLFYDPSYRVDPEAVYAVLRYWGIEPRKCGFES